MGAGAIISMSIIFLCSMIMIAIGIKSIKDVNPCGFYSGETPPSSDEIYDVKSYNVKHGIGWISYGVGMDLVSLLGLFNEIAFCVALLFEVFGGVVLLCVWHHYLYRKYSKG